MPPETRYARSGDAGIAYQVVGHGPIDVVMVPGFPSHVELAWEYPRLAHFYRQLSSVCRLIIMDKRGIGLSDRVPPAELPGLEQRADDVRAVLDDAGVARAAVVGASDGGPPPRAPASCWTGWASPGSGRVTTRTPIPVECGSGR